jgi:broad specificity phosphatase PhoE
MPLHMADEFNELDMGDWTNRTLGEMDLIPE